MLLALRMVEALVFTINVIKALDKHAGSDNKVKRFTNSKLKELTSDTMAAIKPHVPMAVSTKLVLENDR